jgi:glycosyltransferase involved in cell wall biosynthesis
MLVWPATAPHFARPVMEAMVMGSPVVASNYESTAEIIENGVDGLLVKPIRDKIAEGIIKLIEQPELASRMGKEAREKALAIFNSELNNEIIIKLIKRALN